MKICHNSKYTAIAAYSVITFTVCLFIYSLFAHIAEITGAVKTVLNVLSSIIWGAVIAYLLNPIMCRFERGLKKITEKKKRRPKLNRILSVIFTTIVFFAMLAALGAIIVPQVADSIKKIIDNMETYISNLEKWINTLFNDYPALIEIIDNQFQNIEATLTDFVNNIAPKIGDIMVQITDSAISVITAVKDFLIGIIVAVYFLLDKEHFQAQIKKLIYAFLPSKAALGFFKVCNKTNSSISGFIYGKIIDSIIIGFLCFVSMTVMNMTIVEFDYIVLISVIVGVTNIIPFFGPFIGAIPSALLLLMSSPKQVIPFVILIFIIQQLDGNIIGPKILGQSTGLSAFWVLFSILLGGGLFGFMGMVLGVPVFAVIYSFTDEFTNWLLRRKNMSVKTMDYAAVPSSPQKENNEESSC